jgi:hypothetical protein
VRSLLSRQRLCDPLRFLYTSYIFVLPLAFTLSKDFAGFIFEGIEYRIGDPGEYRIKYDALAHLTKDVSQLFCTPGNPRMITG